MDEWGLIRPSAEIQTPGPTQETGWQGLELGLALIAEMSGMERQGMRKKRSGPDLRSSAGQLQFLSPRQ